MNEAEVITETESNHAEQITFLALISLLMLLSLESGGSIDAGVPGVNVTKTWEHDLFQLTSAPRKDHLNVNQESVPLDQDFSIGFNPRESGRAGEDINCMCGITTTYQALGAHGTLVPNSRFGRGIASEVF